MELSRVIIGPVVTEKAERLKGTRTYTLRVANGATKVDVAQALKRFYDVNVTSVRSMRTNTKARLAGRGKMIVKRGSFKKVLVTLSKDSKTLDVSAFAS